MSKSDNKATQYVGAMGGGEPKPKRANKKFLVRHIMPSDTHGFVGRVYDLSIVAYHFDTIDELMSHPDCKYAYLTNHWLTGMATRVESLNLVGDMLWPEPLPSTFKDMPISRYDWLTVATDVFLLRYISVVDCALILSNMVFELGLNEQQCKLSNLKKSGLPNHMVKHLKLMMEEQGDLRSERNARIHHGNEREFTDDDQTFKTASLFNDKLHGMTGTDRYGRPIDVDRSFREGLVVLQRDFNQSTRRLKNQLDQLYDLLWDEFEDRFGPRIAAATHGKNANSKIKK